MSDLLRWLPYIALACGVVGTWAVMRYQLKGAATKEEVALAIAGTLKKEDLDTAVKAIQGSQLTRDDMERAIDASIQKLKVSMLEARQKELEAENERLKGKLPDRAS